MTGTISLAVYGRDPLEEDQRYVDAVGALRDTSPALEPESWVYDEPKKKAWTGDDMAREAARSGELSADLRGGGRFHVASKRTPFICHTQVSVDAPADDLGQDGLVGLLRALAAVVDANYGYLHLLHPPAWMGGRLRYAWAPHGSDATRLSVPPWLLELYLPNIYWGSVFGPDYVKWFGRDRLSTTPSAVAEEFDTDRFYLQATDRLADCAEDNDLYVAAADAAMDHLGRAAFVDPADYRRPGQTPDFSHLREAEPPRPYVPLSP